MRSTLDYVRIGQRFVQFFILSTVRCDVIGKVDEKADYAICKAHEIMFEM